jgi:hypothetical protein
MGMAYSKKWIKQCEQAFLNGYFGNQPIPEKAIIFYEIMCLLDQWVSLTEALKVKSGILIHKIRSQSMDNYYQKLLHYYIRQFEVLKR